MESYRAVKQKQAQNLSKNVLSLSAISNLFRQRKRPLRLFRVSNRSLGRYAYVYAYSLREGQTRRYSDDGEPQGTAGIPTLDVLQKADITDAVVVVTRYFGGILLGGGGLVRAYSHAASLAVEASGVLYMRQCLLAELICDYTQYGKIASLIPECVGVIDDTVFEDTVHIKFHMAHEDFQAFEKRLADTTCGAVKAVVTGKEFFAVSET
ncbi:MAG: YigZ family protein [Acutalibacteraceae bacterium]